MREIKFRGHDGTAWYYGDLIHDSCNGHELIFIDDNVERTRHSVDKDTVGQFTGIKDISGAEIYEGDIVTFKDDETDENVRGLVTYSVEGTWLVVCDGFIEYLSFVRKTTLIMGNVHDNPDLLEVEHDRRD